MNNTFFVSGITCDACVKLIRLYVERIAGVTEVIVSREKGVVYVTSSAPITVEQVQASLDKTPYQITQ